MSSQPEPSEEYWWHCWWVQRRQFQVTGSAGLRLGAVYGAVIALMIVLSRGKGGRQHAVYIFPPSVISGALIGILVARISG